MPSRMTVQESHDIALVLQHKVESFDEVERAFVHGKSFLKAVPYPVFLKRPRGTINQICSRAYNSDVLGARGK